MLQWCQSQVIMKWGSLIKSIFLVLNLGIFWENHVDTAADAMAPFTSRPSAAIALITQAKCVLVSHTVTKKDFKYHDDVIKWKHFPHHWPFVRGIHWSPVNFPHKGQWRGALMFSLICAWMKDWVNNREAGNLRCHHAHYDITVMFPNSKDLRFNIS